MKTPAFIASLSLLTITCFLAGVPHNARAAAMDNFPTARLRMLDKVTARISTFDVRVDTTVRFGQLYIRPRACRKSSPLDAPESASFLQIWEVTPKQDAQWIFSGWMFSSSPALSSMDNPIYDVWVLDCVGDMQASAQDTGHDAGQPAFSSGGHTEVSFMSGGQISYASGQIQFSSSSALPSHDAPATSAQPGATSGVIYSSSGFTASPAETSASPPPAGGGDDAAPGDALQDNAAPDDMPAYDNDGDTGAATEPLPQQPSPQQPSPSSPAPPDEVAPPSTQDPVY